MKNGKANLRKKSPKQNPPINENIPSGNTLSLGELDLIFEINFTDQDLLNPNAKSEDPEKYYKLENLNTIKDLSFISSLSIDFINRIKLKPNNHLIRQILLGNKISKKKNSVELICYNLPLFEDEDEKFFQKIFDKVCMNYKLNINKKPLHEDGRYSLIIILKHKDEYKEIIKGEIPKIFREKKYKEEKEKMELEEEKENEKEEKEKKEREEKKKEKMDEYKEEREKIKSEIIKENAVKSLYINNSEINNNNSSSIMSYNNSQSPSPNKRSPNGSPKGSPNKKIKNKKNKEKKEFSDEEEDIQEDEDYELNEAMKEKKIPKFRRKNSVLCNLSPMSTKYDLFFINFEMIKLIPGDFQMKDFIELLCFFKKKKIFIYINYFKEEYEEDELIEKKKLENRNSREEKKSKNEKNILEERQKKEREILHMKNKISDLKENKNDIKENKKPEITNMTEKKKEEELQKIDLELDKLEEELILKQDDLRAEKEIEIEFKKREEHNKKSEERKTRKQEKKQMKVINDIYFLADAYFFDSKQACDLFTRHFLCYTKDTDKTKRINKQKLFDYFITVISRGRRPVVEGKKLGLFMEDFNKYCIIYTSKNAANKQELNPQPYPKVNTHNINLVNKYKSILTKNKNDYYDVFISLTEHEISANHGIFTEEIIYPTFLAGVDIVKRQVELEKNGISNVDEDTVFKVKIKEKTLKQELEKLSINGKEGNFVLDCTNKNKSVLKDYVSLFDYNLKDFFSSDIIRKNLKNKGFIDSEGYIMYDPLYRDIMGAKYKNLKKYKGEELKSQIINNIKNIDVPARLQDKEFDPKKAAEKQIMPIKRKIPYIKEKKKKNKRGGSSSRSGSYGGKSSSSEGEKSSSENVAKNDENENENNKNNEKNIENNNENNNEYINENNKENNNENNNNENNNDNNN